ncbi:MAG: VWA domain-containing protein [bacterium]|nr:VWA domain-containing protein [bacterium]
MYPRTACLAVLAIAFLLEASAMADSTGKLRLTVDSPQNNTEVATEEGRVFVSGRALALGGKSGKFDVVVVIDVSTSTAAPSGADVDGNGDTGRKQGSFLFPFFTWMISTASTDPGDSILAAEIAAARTLLDQLDPETTRVGVVSFSGDRRPQTRDAFTAVPLTSNFKKVARGLDRLLDEGPHGKTNIAAAVRAASAELTGGLDAASETRPDARKIVLFMTDGQPTLPDPRSRMSNARLAISTARDESRKGIRFDTFAIGKVATADPLVTEEMASVSEGVFTPVAHPADLIAAFEDLDLADIQRLEIRNKTTGRLASDVLLDADGSFSAFVPLAEGINQLEVSALSTDQSRGVIRVDVNLMGEANSKPLPARILKRRARLLENKLLVARERRVAIETERDDSLRKELGAQMEAARLKRSRDLDVQVEEQVPASPRD